jgi:hypothetical protein
MKEADVYSELSSIRSLMERSSKFMSLSGLSGVMAGVYALAGTFLGYRVLYKESGDLAVSDYVANDPQVWSKLVLIAVAVLLLSLTTMIILTLRQSKKGGQPFWTPGSKRLLSNLALPLLTGGILIVILLFKEEYSMIAPACLLFYGLALVSGSHYTFSDVKWLGICEITLGLLCALVPHYGLIFWAIGFGILHILYGSIMHFKYKQ